MNKELKGLRMIITFVDRGQGEKATKLYEKLGAANHQIFLGYGTASSEIYAYLGFGMIEKDVVISLVDVDLVPFMFNALKEEMNFNSPGHGIACSVPILSVGGQRALNAILGITEERN